MEISSYNNYYRKELVSKMKIHCRWLLSCAAIALLTLTVQTVKATPYASCITNSGGNITFYLNESGGNVTVTYEDGSTNENFNGITTGVNLNAGSYTFSLTDHSILHTSYSISVFKIGSGSPSVINSPLQNANSGSGFFIIGDLRGVDVNKNPASPNFGRIYISASERTAPAKPFYSFRSDGSFWSSNSAGITFVATDTGSPYRIAVAPDDYLMVGDYSSNGAAVYRVSPDLTTGKLFLGPVGDVNFGTNATGGGVHGEVFSRPLLLGPLTNNQETTLMYVDNDFPASQPNCILAFTNITTNSLPWETPPSYVGGQDGLPDAYLNNVFPGLTQGTNGYIYASEQRANYATPDMEIFDSTGSNMLWSSQPNSGVAPDYFVTQVEGNGVQGLIDSAVSPDSAYLIGMAIDNHYTICALTNGIPDIRTFYTVNPTSLAQNGRGICWDAADNFYSISSGTAWVQAWTLGLTTTAVTTGNANGPTGFQVTLPPNTGSVTVSNATISQVNSYGNPTAGGFVIQLSSPPTNTVTVSYTFSGTALGATANGVTYPASFSANPPTSVTFAPGQTSAVVTITPSVDNTPRPTTTLTMTLTTSGTFIPVFPTSASMNILNTGPQELFVSQGSPIMYNAFSNDYCSLSITRWGDLGVSAYTVTSFNVLPGGTAQAGTDFSAPSAVTISPNDLTDYSYMTPLLGGQLPLHTNVMTYSGNKAFSVSLVSGTANSTPYTVLANTNSFTIVDAANPPAPVLYYDPLTNAAPTNWIVRASDENYPNTAPDYFVDYAYDLFDDPRGDGVAISFPPNGQSTALRLTTGKSGQVKNMTTYSGVVNLYLTNEVFSGDYAVRFNMNVSQPSIFATAGSFEGPLFGIDCSGNQTNWYLNSSPSAPANTAGFQANFISDGVWVWMTDDQYSQYDPYTLFALGNTSNSPKSITPTVETGTAAFVNDFKTNIFSEAVPGLPCNGSPDDSPIFAPYTNSWADVEIKQYNNVVTLSIDKTKIFSYVNTTPDTNGTVLLGYETPVFGGDGADGAVYYSDLKVVRLTPPAISGSVFNAAKSTFTFNFTTPDGDLTPSSFTVLGSTNVMTGYVPVSGATITQLNTPGAATFQATVPASAAASFYQIQTAL